MQNLRAKRHRKGTDTASLQRTSGQTKSPLSIVAPEGIRGLSGQNFLLALATTPASNEVNFAHKKSSVKYIFKAARRKTPQEVVTLECGNRTAATKVNIERHSPTLANFGGNVNKKNVVHIH